MILAVDCGNSRLKWGLHENGGWREAGAVPVSELARLEEGWRRRVPADKVVVANVAGRSVRKRLETLFARRSMVPAWVKAKRHECGVTNGYGRPDQLGPDRWAALIGAWSILRGPCLVVTAGTATTVDVLDRKSTRLNSSHTVISYAVFCLKKKIQRAHVASCSIQWAEEYRNAAVVDTVTF